MPRAFYTRFANLNLNPRASGATTSDTLACGFRPELASLARACRRVPRPGLQARASADPWNSLRSPTPTTTASTPRTSSTCTRSYDQESPSRSRHGPQQIVQSPSIMMTLSRCELLVAFLSPGRLAVGNTQSRPSPCTLRPSLIRLERLCASPWPSCEVVRCRGRARCRSR